MNVMALRKLQQQTNGDYHCPVCGGHLHRVEGGAVQVIDGQADLESHKPRYECNTCRVFYREVLTSGYYDTFPLLSEKSLPREEREERRLEKPPLPTSPVPLHTGQNGTRFCPRCHLPLRVVEGRPLEIRDGKVDLENTKTKYECDSCGVFYREVLSSGYYLPYPQQEEDRVASVSSAPSAPLVEESAAENTVLSTRDIEPVQLKRDENGYCACPRCRAGMEYVEGGAVRLVDGKPYMDDIWDHFVCKNCNSVFRRIAGTDYFQWSEK